MNNTLILKKEGEIVGSHSDKYFENVIGEDGVKQTKQDKRHRIVELMDELYNSCENFCQVSDGRVVPIVIERTDKIGRKLRYFNTADAPKDEILKAFALSVNINYVEEKPAPKQIGELIAADVNHLFDDIKVNNKKVSGDKKQNRLVQLFRSLYSTPQENICIIKGEAYPIIVERTGYNNKAVCCLNASDYRAEILSAFANWADCVYCQEKEDIIDPPVRQKTEMSTRDSARVYHAVPNLDDYNPKQDGRIRLVEWFKHIYDDSKLNRVILPNGAEAELIVKRKSCSRTAYFLNTSDENIKPFVIKKVADIIGATICIDNLKINTTDTQTIHNIIFSTKKEAKKSLNEDDANYYNAYAQIAYNTLSTKKEYITVNDWIKNNSKSK